MQTSYTAFDTTGQSKLTDTDQLMEQRRREAADQAFRGALANSQNNMQREGWDRQSASQREGWNRQDTMRAQDMSAQERIAAANNANQLAMGGSYGDRSANAFKLAEMQMSPARMAQEFEQKKWGEGEGLRQAQRNNEIMKAQAIGSLFDGLNGQSAPAVGGPPDAGAPGSAPPAAAGAPAAQNGGRSPMQMRLLMSLAGINPSQMDDPQDVMVRQMVNQSLAAKLASGELNPQQFSAAAKGDYTQIPKKTNSAISTEQQIEAFQNDTQQFAEKDAATFGFDPDEEAIQRLVAQRDQTAKALKSRDPRLSDEEALAGANFYAEQSVKKNGNDQRWGTGWIAKLRQALAGQGGAQVTQAPQASAKDMGAAYGPGSGMIRGGY